MSTPSIDATSSGTSTIAGSISWSHTVGSANSNYVLLVGVAIKSNATTSVSTITWNTSQSLTRLGRVVDSGSHVAVELWFLAAPAAGTFTVAVTLGASASVTAGSVSYYNANQSTPTGVVTNSGPASTSTSTTVSGTNTNELVIDMFATDGNATATATASQTNRWSNTTHCNSYQDDVAGSATSTALTWNLSVSDAWGEVAAPLASPGVALTATLAGVGTLTGTLSTATPGALSATLAGVGTLVGTTSLRTALTTILAGAGTLAGTLSLVIPATFYGSNVASTIGGLTLSDQMSMTPGGVETSVTITAPSSGTNSYIELASQGGVQVATATLPAPTGKGWSINLSGYTLFPGDPWSAVLTFSKSGTSLTTGSLFVRFYRRTMDGTYYAIGQVTLSAQTFSTTKTVYTFPNLTTVTQAWQFIAWDTFYVDAIAYNGATAWASDVFTFYVSNSATVGVTGDIAIYSPTPQVTQTGLTCLVSNTAIPVLDQTLQLADALDNRSILSVTGKDTAGTLSFVRGQPLQLSDSTNGLLYTGYVNSDKLTKVGPPTPELQHAMTFMDNHYLADKSVNTKNYLNWNAGHIVCDFIQQSLSAEGVWGEFAMESDSSPATFGAGTLTNAVATTTTSPFTYAPNTTIPPITTNTGDLEIASAGSTVTITEQTTSDFSSGTLTNMVTASNSLSPTTQSALKVTAGFPVAGETSIPASATYSTSWTATAESIANSTYAQIWSGSQTIGSNDTLNYDLWIASTSPAFLAGIDFVCSDGTRLSAQVGTVESNLSVGLSDQNNLSVDVLTDLSNYAKDTWYTRTIALSGLSGKSITTVSLFIAGSSAGVYTVYVKNCYLGSASGSPFFGTSATAPQTNPPVVTTLGGYSPSTVTAMVTPAYDCLTCSRTSSAYSISSVGLVRSSTITWTASLPTNGPSVPTAVSPYTIASATQAKAPTMVMLVSYDGATWLPCADQQPLPGLPAGANVTGVSLYLREQFAAGSDPTAIPSLLQVTITIHSAANQTTSDVTAAFGTATQWNSGTYAGTGLTSLNQLSLGTLTHNWSSTIITGQTFWSESTSGGPATQSASTGAYGITATSTGANDVAGLSRFDFLGFAQNFTLECDMKISNANVGAGLIYRAQSWMTGPPNTVSGNGYVILFYSGSLYFGVLAYASTNYPGEVGLAPGATLISHTFSTGVNHHFKVVVAGDRHTIYLDNSSTPIIDILDTTLSSGGGFGFMTQALANVGGTGYINTIALSTASSGTWTSPSISLSALGTCGNTHVAWNELNASGSQQATAVVLASLNGGTTWQECINGTPIPGLSPGTSVTGTSLLIRAILSASSPLATPTITGLSVRVCGSYGTVTGTRISPILSLSPVGYIANSHIHWYANTPTNTACTIDVSQDSTTWTNIPAPHVSLPFWTNQPASTQDLFNTNTSANYTNTFKSGGSASTWTYTTSLSNITASGGSGGLYLNSAINCADTEILCDMDESDAGGLVWQYQNTSNYYELGVYDASSSGGFTNQLRLYKVSSGTRTLLGSASAITFTRGTFHRIRVKQEGGLIDVYFDGQCMQSYLDLVPLGAGLVGLRNDGGTSRYYQLYIQPLGTKLSGQALYTRVTLSTSDPAQMPQLFVLMANVRGPSIGTGSLISQLHTVTTPFAAYFASEMNSLIQASGDYYWYIDMWKQLRFGPRTARQGAFPIQSADDPAKVAAFLLYEAPGVSITSSADLFRNQQVVTDVTNLVTPPPEIKVADGSTTSWNMGYPLYSAPTITINGQPATVGVQGIDNGRQFYWQPGNNSINYDTALPKLPAGAILAFQYVGQSVQNVILNDATSQANQAVLEGNSGIVAEIESALNADTRGMTTAQATTFGQGLLTRLDINNPIELNGSILKFGLRPGTVTSLFIPEMGVWNKQVPVIKVTTTGFQKGDGTVLYQYLLDCTTGPNISNWVSVWNNT